MSPAGFEEGYFTSSIDTLGLLNSIHVYVPHTDVCIAQLYPSPEILDYLQQFLTEEFVYYNHQ
jgi:hypothetical protein